MQDETVEIGERKFVFKKDEEKEALAVHERADKEEKHKEFKKDKKKEKKKEDRKKNEEPEKKPHEKSREKQDLTEKRRAERRDFYQSASESLEAGVSHDMRDQALGRMAGTRGGRVDYDELRRMAANGIRDSDELVSESMENHGFDANVERIMKMMDGYIHEGKPDINTIAKLDTYYKPGEIAQAYVNTAKGATMGDLRRLERIDDVCDFDRPVYENKFDEIRRYDRDADTVLDRLETEFGKERS